ncbi:hypothetical protein N7533_003525 [Penicillium manginii]|jgi:hypothetical protein|uniref:uncharacterized protein n=1 Tax=Penicillium manginii TaxID=203109 RepID=UPI0025492112|nr:uncharacterized protein N7533_003525 [Penicillium manginii]KAJ5761486.1 hypothetical protein N7533_003525 [Penicillium manginii]
MALATDTQLASQTNGLTLLDVYFAQFIPSSILSQQGRTKRLFLNGELCTGVLQGMFALASLFLGRTQAPSKWRRLDDSADVSQIAPHHGQDWANNAGHIASLQLHMPSVDTVRTLSNLTTYWFGIGQRERSQAGASKFIPSSGDFYTRLKLKRI